MKTFFGKEGIFNAYPNSSGSTMLSGSPYLIGTNTIAIPECDIADGSSGAVRTRGQFTVPKVTGRAWTVGAVLFWDVSASKFDVVAGTPATGDIVGCAQVVAAAASGDTIGIAELQPLNGTVT